MNTGASLLGRGVLALLSALTLAAAAAGAASAAAGDTTLVSVGNWNDPADGGISAGASVSGDGRFVAFESPASDLVRQDANRAIDVFVRDLQARTTRLVSRNSSGEQANNASEAASISADGSFVAFTSRASNLISDDSNGVADVFVRDRLSETTERVSLSNDDEQGNNASRASSISADGRYVAFESLASNLAPDDTDRIGTDGNGSTIDVFVRDRQGGNTELVGVSSSGEGANDTSDGASFSGDGRFVAFRSVADNLVANDTNGQFDVFAHQLLP